MTLRHQNVTVNLKGTPAPPGATEQRAISSFCGGLSASPRAPLSSSASLGLDLHGPFHLCASHMVPTGKELSHSHPHVLELGPLIILLPDPSNEPNPRGT